MLVYERQFVLKKYDCIFLIFFLSKGYTCYFEACSSIAKHALQFIFYFPKTNHSSLKITIIITRSHFKALIYMNKILLIYR